MRELENFVIIVTCRFDSRDPVERFVRNARRFPGDIRIEASMAILFQCHLHHYQHLLSLIFSIFRR